MLARQARIALLVLAASTFPTVAAAQSITGPAGQVTKPPSPLTQPFGGLPPDPAWQRIVAEIQQTDEWRSTH